MNKFAKVFLSLYLLTNILFLPTLVFAADDTMGGLLNEAAGAEGAGYNTAADTSATGLARIIGSVIQIFISFLGIIFICYTIYGGFLWMTAAGNDEKITKAKSIMRDGVIGIAIILMSAAIYLVIRNLLLAGTISTPVSS